MFKWLEKFKFKKNKIQTPVQSENIERQSKPAHFCVEFRVDEKGLIYYPKVAHPYLEFDPESYSAICQVIANVALMEMREKNRTVH